MHDVTSCDIIGDMHRLWWQQLTTATQFVLKIAWASPGVCLPPEPFHYIIVRMSEYSTAVSGLLDPSSDTKPLDLSDAMSFSDRYVEAPHGGQGINN